MCYYNLVPIYVVEEVVVTFVMVVESLCTVKKYLVEEYRLVNLYCSSDFFVDFFCC